MSSETLLDSVNILFSVDFTNIIAFLIWKFWCYLGSCSSHCVLWIPTLSLHTGLLDSDTAGYCSRNGWHFCEQQTSYWFFALGMFSLQFCNILSLMLQEDTAAVVSTVLFISGVTTLLHTFFGSSLPLIQGPSFVYLAPALAIINAPEFQGLNGNVCLFSFSIHLAILCDSYQFLLQSSCWSN